MNFKKLAITGATAALLLASAAPGFAHYDGPYNGYGGTLIVNDNTNVVNTVGTLANTGGNLIVSEDDDVNGGLINTGNAGSATLVSNIVNTNSVDNCGCYDFVGIFNGNTSVGNNVLTGANTGGNVIAAYDDVDGGEINSGNAGAGAVVSNVVNTNVVNDFGWWPGPID